MIMVILMVRMVRMATICKSNVFAYLCMQATTYGGGNIGMQTVSDNYEVSVVQLPPRFTFPV